MGFGKKAFESDNCDICGRWLQGTWTYKCDKEGIVTDDGKLICGCCLPEYYEEEKRKLEIKLLKLKIKEYEG